jgi:anti-sigma-K factor RskA
LSGVIIFANVIKPEATRETFPVAILNGIQSNTQFVVSMDNSRTIIQVSSLGVTLPQNKSLQLWMIKGNSLPRSLGIINHSDNNTFRLLPDKFDNQTVLAISLEPVGGSKQAGPSGPVIYQGKVIKF